MTLSLTDAHELSQSDIRNMSLKCDAVKGINLSQGICDLQTPAQVLDGAARAISAGENFYTRYDGISQLREAISKKLRKYNNVNADAEGEIVVSSGATGALFSAMLALLKRGDGVLLFEPFYGYHLHTLHALGLNPVFVKTSPPDWEFGMEEFEAAASKCKAVLINTPCNPSGKVFSKEELSAISEVCRRKNLIVFTDEIYEYFVYGGRKHISPASIEGMLERTVTISGYSKTFSITGWRVGYLACRKDWAQRAGHISDLLYVCAPSPLQWGVAAGINALPDSFYSDISSQYLKKRDILCGALSEAGLAPFVPQGAYYVLADSSKLPGKDSSEKALWLLEKSGVAAVPGRAFFSGRQGDNLLRFCFAKEDAVLSEACGRLSALRL